MKSKCRNLLLLLLLLFPFSRWCCCCVCCYCIVLVVATAVAAVVLLLVVAVVVVVAVILVPVVAAVLVAVVLVLAVVAVFIVEASAAHERAKRAQCAKRLQLENKLVHSHLFRNILHVVFPWDALSSASLVIYFVCLLCYAPLKSLVCHFCFKIMWSMLH